MGPNFQSSFIPKGPVTSSEPFQKKKGSIFSTLIVIFFILVLIMTAGLYMYKKMLEGNIESLKSQLVEAEKNIDSKSIKRMYDFSRKLSIARGIVQNHLVASNAIEALSSSTVRSVNWNSFVFDSDLNTFRMNVKGSAPSYAAVALQENALKNEKSFQSISFSNLTLSEKGSISFDAVITVEAGALRYDPPISVSVPLRVSTSTATSTSLEDDLAPIDLEVGDISFEDL